MPEAKPTIFNFRKSLVPDVEKHPFHSPLVEIQPARLRGEPLSSGELRVCFAVYSQSLIQKGHLGGLATKCSDT